MRTLTLLAAFALAVIPAAAEEIVTAYTDLNTDRDCSVFEVNEEGGEFVNLLCNGWKGYPVLISPGT